MHYYSFHPADYTLDTVHLDNEHDLAYRRLLDLYYTSEQPIPSETQRVSSRLRVGLQVLENVLREFFHETPNGWVQDNCERKIAQYHAKADAARENGKRGGRPPRLKETQSVILANPVESGRNPAESGSKANQEPRTINQEPKTKRFSPPELSDWIAYGLSLTPAFPHNECTKTYDFYTSKGWKVGDQPMRDWKAALRTCHGRWRDTTPNGSKPRQPSLPHL